MSIYKKPQGNIIFHGFLQGKVQIQLAYGLPKQIVIIKMMFYKNTKAMIRLSDGNTTFFNIVSGVLQGFIDAT